MERWIRLALWTTMFVVALWPVERDGQLEPFCTRVAIIVFGSDMIGGNAENDPKPLDMEYQCDFN